MLNWIFLIVLVKLILVLFIKGVWNVVEIGSKKVIKFNFFNCFLMVKIVVFVFVKIICFREL